MNLFNNTNSQQVGGSNIFQQGNPTTPLQQPQQQSSLFSNNQQASSNLFSQNQKQPQALGLNQPAQQGLFNTSQNQQGSLFQNPQQQGQFSQGNLFNNQSQQPQQSSLFSQQQQQQQPGGLLFQGGGNLLQNQNLNQAQQQTQQNLFLPQQNPLKEQKVSMDNNDFQKTFNNFYEAIDQNSTNCLFRTPGLSGIPVNVDNYQYFNKIVPDMSVELWHNMQKKNPNPSKYYVNLIRGWDQMNTKSISNHDFLKNLDNQNKDHLTMIQNIKSQTNQNIKQKIVDLKKRNAVILDKILSIHNTIEKVSIRWNNLDRNINQEMALFREQQDMDQSTQEMNVKIKQLNVKVLHNLEQNTDQEINFNKIEESNDETQRESLLELMNHMKKGKMINKYVKGLEVLKKISSNTIDDYKALENILAKSRHSQQF